MDALVHHTMCKHIHLVASTQAEAQDMGKKMEPTLVYSPLLQVLKQKGQSRDINIVRERVLRTLSTLTAQISQCTSVEGLLAAEKHLLSAKSSCRLISASVHYKKFPIRQIEPANKKIKPQRPFSSTKSKPKKPTIKLGKATAKQKELINSTLLLKRPLYDTADCSEESAAKDKRENISGKLYLLQQYIDHVRNIIFYLIEMLLWFCDNLTSVENALDHGHQIQIDKVEAQAQEIPDSVVDRSTDVLKTYCSQGAWKTVAETSEQDYQMAVLFSKFLQYQLKRRSKSGNVEAVH